MPRTKLGLDRTGLSRQFAHTLIPIALAYLVAHYFSAFLYQEQAQFTYILSDPLGHGSDLFGTAGTQINYTIIGATGTWYWQVAFVIASTNSRFPSMSARS